MNINIEAATFAGLVDLASEYIGGSVLYATDEFFAAKENLLKPGRGIFISDKYTDRGKWMDGWESRRKRTPGHDWCIIKLGLAGFIKGVDIDTNHFLGNNPAYASIEACSAADDATVEQLESASWMEILTKSPTKSGSQNLFAIFSQQRWSHIRFHIYPDGGVARLRVYGEVLPDWNKIVKDEPIDLAFVGNGGCVVAASDMFFGSKENLIMPGRGVNMGDGWETKRNRTPGNRDWVILKLATPGNIEKIIVDTCHFKGNYPDSCSIEACISYDDASVINNEVEWKTILPAQKLSADHEHEFVKEINKHDPITHVRLNIFPDGGVSRLSLFGTIAK